ncbi:uncharacterized protein EHS24_000925 [Apiotrichum porosum]|uniref:VOC domain-containing protein n=1 Tax=Apiotrichum porosum TaxID=105984 RepID=A0A427YBE4_9TREE|nr:uncharacterized protein EHS24_000925 [Apiotrichum porosum]RSH88385.1 hypothetical protein EHS24_000925 [Apiotrichum porosum]
MPPKLRIARPVRDPALSSAMWCGAFALTEQCSFKDHAGFDGVMLGHPGSPYHFEFTICRTHVVTPAPTDEDLTVFYYPDEKEWAETCQRAEEHGFVRVSSFNPYWDDKGRTYADRDGYRVVLQQAEWTL